MENQVSQAYVALAATARTLGEEEAIDQLRQAINVDPSLAALMRIAMRRSAICDMGVYDEAIPV